MSSRYGFDEETQQYYQSVPKKAIEENPKEIIIVLVDSAVSMENVSRLAKSKGYSVEIEEMGEGSHLRLSPPRE